MICMLNVIIDKSCLKNSQVEAESRFQSFFKKVVKGKKEGIIYKHTRPLLYSPKTWLRPDCLALYMFWSARLISSLGSGSL